MVSEFINFETIRMSHKKGIEKFTEKILIILKKRVYFLTPTDYNIKKNTNKCSIGKTRCSDEQF